MDGPNLFVSTCSRRELARRRASSRTWRGRYLRWRETGGRSRVAGMLLTGGVDLLIAVIVVAGIAAYVVGRGGI